MNNNITNKIYLREDFVQGFHKTYGKNTLTSDFIREREKELTNNKKVLLEETKNKEITKEQCERLIEEIDTELKYLKKAMSIYTEYGQKTMDAFNDGYKYTVRDISRILVLDENYITRNLMPFFDYFELNYIARSCIKNTYTKEELVNMGYQNAFLNKKVFISKDSFESFIKEHCKVTFQRMQIICDFEHEKEKYNKLLDKFKSKDDIKKAIGIIIDELDLAAEGDVGRKLLKTYDMEDDMVEGILTEKDGFIVQSIATLKRAIEETPYSDTEPEITISERVIIEEMFEKILNRNNKYNATTHAKLTDSTIALLLTAVAPDKTKYRSINDTQIYKYMEHKMTATRFIFDGVKKDGETKNIVRYLASAEQICHVRENLDKWIYSLQISAVNDVVGVNSGNLTDKEKNEKVKKYIYNRLMDKTFQLYCK